MCLITNPSYNSGEFSYAIPPYFLNISVGLENPPTLTYPFALCASLPCAITYVTCSDLRIAKSFSKKYFN